MLTQFLQLGTFAKPWADERHLHAGHDRRGQHSRSIESVFRSRWLCLRVQWLAETWPMQAAPACLWLVSEPVALQPPAPHLATCTAVASDQHRGQQCSICSQPSFQAAASLRPHDRSCRCICLFQRDELCQAPLVQIHWVHCWKPLRR